MKSTALYILLLATAGNLFAQKPIVLKFEKHAIKSESNNEMNLCKYVDPGNGGENVTWNFSGIETTNGFTGVVKSSYHSTNSSLFPQANTDLQEFNNHFYFNISNNRIEQYGYSSLDNLVVTTFDRPFVKMIYPFTMGDNFRGTFSGIYKSGNSTGDISGNYEVTGDGYGTLILPGNYTVENTLRVKTLKTFSQVVSGITQTYEIVTYRWYCDWFRYPLLVLTQIKMSVNESTSVTYQAAFNNKATKAAENPLANVNSDKLFDLYPNPTNQFININYVVANDGLVTIELFDLSGKKISTFLNEEMKAGNYTLQPNLVNEGLFKGTYFVKVAVNGKSETQQLVLTK